MRRATLLIHRSRPESWSKRFDAHGLGAIGALPTLAFEQFTMLFQAVIAGLVVAFREWIVKEAAGAKEKRHRH